MNDETKQMFFEQLAMALLINYCNGQASIPQSKWFELENYKDIAYRFNHKKKSIEVKVVGKDKTH